MCRGETEGYLRCDLSHNAFDVTTHSPSPVDRETPVKTLPSSTSFAACKDTLQSAYNELGYHEHLATGSDCSLKRGFSVITSTWL